VRIGQRSSSIISHAFAWFIGLVWLIPFLGVFIASIRPYSEIIHGWWNVDTVTLTLDNYIGTWNHQDYPLSNAIPNSLIIALPSTVVPVLVGSLAAYSFMRFKFPLKSTLFMLTVVLIMLPIQAVILPDFLTMFRLGLWNTHLGVIILHSAFGLPWIILFLRNFFESLPMDILDQGRVDGASDFQIFYRLVLPMSLPALVSIAAIQFVWVWNDYFVALVMLRPPYQVATQVLPLIKGHLLIDWGGVAGASVITMSIPILVYVLLGKYYVKGIVGGTVKG